jgi:hypothetical protein
MDEILRMKFGDDIKVVVLDHLTRGSVESCLYASEYIDNDAPLVIHTLDIEFAPVFDPKIVGSLLADGVLLTFKSNSANYSYAKCDDENYVTETAEKKAISSDACVGIYGFKRGSDFCKYAKKMIADDIRTNNEFYIAPLYNLLIKNGLKIITHPVDKMHVFGTPDEFNFYKKNVVKRFGDKPFALCCDHSGYEAKELFKSVLKGLGKSISTMVQLSIVIAITKTLSAKQLRVLKMVIVTMRLVSVEQDKASTCAPTNTKGFVLH